MAGGGGNRESALSGPGSALQWVKSGSDLVSFTFVCFLREFSYHFYYQTPSTLPPSLI